jgi:hypothetical protein
MAGPGNTHAAGSRRRKRASATESGVSRARASIVGRVLAAVSLAACLALASFGLTAIASTAPTVTLKARVLPVPINPSSAKSRNYPKTGNILGAGASLETLFEIRGTEYGGFPSPLTGVVAYLPAGTKLHPAGFQTCSQAILESHEVSKCPRKSVASPKGEVTGVVSFGQTRVEEKATVQAFFTAGGKLAFYTEGTSPVSLEILSTGSFSTASKPYGPKLTAPVPLVETVPGAPYASVYSIRIKVGAAYKRHKKLVSYGTVPKRCPRGGFPGKAELQFLSGETVTVSTKVPCPKIKRKR